MKDEERRKISFWISAIGFPLVIISIVGGPILFGILFIIWINLAYLFGNGTGTPDIW